MSVEEVEIVLPTNGEELKRIKEALIEFSNNQTQMESFKELNKDIIDSLYEKYKVNKSKLRKIAMIHHKAERDKVVGEMNQIDEAYETIFGKE